MGKIKLLLNVGTCFSATSPFHYTVSLDHKCVWTGHTKESQYLYYMMSGKDSIRLNPEKMVKGMPDIPKDKPDDWYQKHLSAFWDEIAQKGLKPDILGVHSEYIGDKWTQEEVDEFFRSSLSIEKYIRYYKKHWENVKGIYEWVGDFSNQGAVLSIPFMYSIRDELLDTFDIKVTMQFRDPVRRLFSAANKNVKLGYYPDKTPIEVMYQWLGGAFEPNAYYSSIYRRHAQIWGKENVKAIVMEDFWNPDNKKEQLAELSDFMDYKFTKIHRNVYYPDMGSKAPKYEYLGDQFSSDFTDLTDDQYKKCFELMKEVYTEYKKTFGYLPDAWGK